MQQGWRAGLVVFALLAAWPGQAAEFTPSADLLTAAAKEGKLVLYTANFLDTEQVVVKRFSERFPGIKWDGLTQ